MNKKRMFTTIVLVVVLAMIFPVSALAGTWTANGITLTIPNSDTTCAPSGYVTTSGVGSNTVEYLFAIYDATTASMITLETGSIVGDFNLPFPYPPNIGGTMTFFVGIRVYTDTGITKISGQWKITCTPSGQGCTPGYWRNHYDMWPAPYVPGSSFNNAFLIPANFYAPGAFSNSYTLGQGIWQGGGGLNRLARHGTAALLSAASPFVNYPFTVNQVIQMVQLGTIDPLAAANELGCPIN